MCAYAKRVQMEIRLSLAVIVGHMRVSLDGDKMAATSPAALIEGARNFLTLFQAGGVHLRMAPRS
jgi:hypothetical protein